MYPRFGQKSIYDKLNINAQNNQNTFQRKNQANITNNNNVNNYINKEKSNLKYGDLHFETHFSDGNYDSSSQKDIQLKVNLNKLESQYKISYEKVNNFANQFSGGNEDIARLNGIKKELKEMDSYFANEYGKFIGQLYEITQDSNLLNYDFKKYIENPKYFDDKLKKIIIDHKYDVILDLSKNYSDSNLKRIKNYIQEKKKNNNIQNENINSFDPQNNYENQKKESQQFNFGNSIYGDTDKNKGYQQQYGFGNNIYSNQNNRKYENPNEVGSNDYYENNRSKDYREKNVYGNNYNPNQSNSSYHDNRKIKVKFIYQNNEKNHEFESNASGALLFYKSVEIKDEPKIYDQKGRFLTFDILNNMRIKDIFEYEEPTLNIY